MTDDFTKIGEVVSSSKPKPPAYEWQQFALQIIKELNIPAFKKSAVFKVCKQYPKPHLEQCLNDTKELCQTGEKWKYFFKIVENLIK